MVKKLITQFVCIFLVFCGSLGSARANDKPTLSLYDLTYSYKEMLEFDVHTYIENQAPHLSDYAELISHYAGKSGTSPRIIIALIEMESGLINQNAGDVELPFGDLSSQYGFKNQLNDVGEQLLLFRHGKLPFAHSWLAIKIGELSLTVYQLFPDYDVKNNDQKSARKASKAATTPPWNMLSLPYPVGDTWYVGGAHANDGGAGVHSSLDLSTGGFGWGADLSNIWVSSAAPGTVKVHSSCFIEVIHDGGWSTTYYHMSDLQWTTGASINRNTNLGHYASNYAQAICDGGSSTGPHLHFSLKKDGYQHSLNNVFLSGYKVKATSNTSYDTDCTKFNLSQWGSSWCAGNFFNPGVDVYSGLTIEPLNGTTNTKLYYKMVVPEAPIDANKIRFQTWGGTGDADIYVKKGSVPTLTSYDCRPYEQGNREVCDTSKGLSSSIGGTWYVMINGANTFQNLSLGVNHSGWYDIANVTQSLGNWNRSYINVPDGISKLTVTVSGGTGDADLYLNYGAEPSGSLWQCRPYQGAGVTEVCTIDNPKSGIWHIGIYSYSALANVQLKARWHP